MVSDNQLISVLYLEMMFRLMSETNAVVPELSTLSC